LVAGLLMAGVRQRKLPAAAARPAPRETREKPMLEYAGHKTRGGGDTQVPLHAVAWVLAGVVLLAAVAVVPMTDSNGGMAAGILCVVAVVIAGVFGERIAARRRVWAIAALGLAAAGAAGLISYGVVRHGLPTKSLLFRWQYWSGSIPMVRQFPAWGVGLNNFGDYYTRFKSPSWPEDVKDPHNFFVRLAAEAGLPATIGLALWLGWWLWGALGAPRRSQQVRAEFSIPALLAAGAGALLWALLRMLGLPYSDFELIMSFIYGGFGLLSFSAVLYLLCHLEEKGIDASRQVAVAGVLSALAMLLYDQVNMALVTGSCATLFWMLLAVGDASRGSDPAKPPRLPGSVSGLMALIGALATLLFWLLPRGAGAIDPAPREYGYVMHFNHLAEDLDRKDQAAAAGDAARALEALDSAIALSPLNGELYNQRILLNRLLARQNLPSEPTADDIRKLFALDAANARPRVDQAMPDSDLPGNERIAALEQALQFDAALAPDEPKRLSDAQKAAIRDKISELKGRH
ncbi:MAG TPA: O-antigen ligase family protein, partial [Phycisphaerae bacterium]|nr:O-antigen ligase family protein [Phycisphaerae bacterium]